jgi:hypothetical protein
MWVVADITILPYSTSPMLLKDRSFFISNDRLFDLTPKKRVLFISKLKASSLKDNAEYLKLILKIMT